MGFATYEDATTEADTAIAMVNVKMSKDAARTFVDVLLNSAMKNGSQHERDWLLWGVGLIAQAGKHSESGPHA